MKRSQFTEAQIIGMLREQAAGAKTADVCRKHGISGATSYKWKGKYGGLDVSEERRQLQRIDDLAVARVHLPGSRPQQGALPSPATLKHATGSGLTISNSAAMR